MGLTTVALAVSFLLGKDGPFDPFQTTVAEMYILRLVRDGKKDSFSNLVLTTVISGTYGALISQNIKLLDPALIQARPILKSGLRHEYPVWINKYLHSLPKDGKIPDKELFRAVLNGKPIDL